MNESQKLASMQRRAYEIEQGIITERGDENFEDEFYGIDDEESSSISNNIAPQDDSKLVTHKNTDVMAVEQLIPNTTDPTQLAALEKVRALAVSMGISSSVSNPVVNILPSPTASSITLTSDGKVDTKAALQRAKLIAMQMGGLSGEQELQEQMHFMDELEINDYPANVRRKVTQRSVLDEITDRTGTNIISRGTYVPPGKKLEIGERKLFLLIEGPTEMQVKQAKIEVVRMLEEETLRQGVSGQVGFGGRYNVT
jgi:hypothetical protein